MGEKSKFLKVQEWFISRDQTEQIYFLLFYSNLTL